MCDGSVSAGSFLDACKLAEIRSESDQRDLKFKVQPDDRARRSVVNRVQEQCEAANCFCGPQGTLRRVSHGVITLAYRVFERIKL